MSQFSASQALTSGKYEVMRVLRGRAQTAGLPFAPDQREDHAAPRRDRLDWNQARDRLAVTGDDDTLAGQFIDQGKQSPARARDPTGMSATRIYSTPAATRTQHVL